MTFHSELGRVIRSWDGVSVSSESVSALLLLFGCERGSFDSIRLADQCAGFCLASSLLKSRDTKFVDITSKGLSKAISLTTRSPLSAVDEPSSVALFLSAAEMSELHIPDDIISGALSAMKSTGETLFCPTMVCIIRVLATCTALGQAGLPSCSGGGCLLASHARA